MPLLLYIEEKKKINIIIFIQKLLSTHKIHDKYTNICALVFIFDHTDFRKLIFVHI